MRAILSTTTDPLYGFFAPIACYSWHLLGVRSVLFEVHTAGSEHHPKVDVTMVPGVARFIAYQPTALAPTYSQVVRLYAAALEWIQDDEILITSDIDMAVFSDYFTSLPATPSVTGFDLTEVGQYPLCYLSASAGEWRKLMGVGGRSLEVCMRTEMAGWEGDDVRGNYWSRDQEIAYQRFAGAVLEPRRTPSGLAADRADRVSWTSRPAKILDAHLPRPGWEENSIRRIIDLFSEQYPDRDHSWIRRYRDEYVKAL